MPYQYKPDISVKLSPRITKSTHTLVGRVCRRHKMFESDVLRFTLEAIAPEAARRGVAWLISQVPSFEKLGHETYSYMVTVRTSTKVKSALDKLSVTQAPADVLRYCYLVALPIALRKGFGPIMAMREKNLTGQT